jgi:uncharacterized protein YdhG (YjbR/CyaY superfamily)
MADKPTFTTIDEYIALFPDDIQVKLQEIRETIRATAPEATEAITYKMPAFKLNGTLVNFAAWKGHIALYPAPEGVAEFAEELAQYDTSGKGALRLPLDAPLPHDLIGRIVLYRVAENAKKAT